MGRLISIIMPFKNAAPYLEACMESIIKQTEKNWELLAVNDHSSDKSYEIVRYYAEKDNRIKIFNNKGDGIIPALQTGYEFAKGDMIHRMDADDLMPERKLKLLSDQLVKVGRGNVVTGKVEYFAAKGVGEGYQQYENWLNTLCDNHSHWQSIYKECVVASPAWLVYKDDFEACGGFQSDIYPEDYDLVFRFYKTGYSVKAVPEVVHLWRDHPDRASRNHPHYKTNTFFELKLHYFFELDRVENRPLVLWGAGPKGKLMAKLLKAGKQEFVWASNNPNKHGHDIYNQIMHSIDEIMQLRSPQILITIAQRNAQIEIRNYLDKYQLKEHQDYLFFS